MTPDRSASVGQLIELERAQIGNELHDQLLPLVFAASATLESVQRRLSELAKQQPDLHDQIDPAMDRLEQSTQWLKQSLSLGRDLLTQIYPPELDQTPWLVAARDAAMRIAGDACEIKWHVDPASPTGQTKWDRDQALVAYRVLIESIRNATLHGKATSIIIRCEPSGILIVDDGIGFDPDKVDSNRYGIRCMKNRAAAVGQTVSISSQPGGPTTVKLEFQTSSTE